MSDKITQVIDLVSEMSLQHKQRCENDGEKP